MVLCLTSSKGQPGAERLSPRVPDTSQACLTASPCASVLASRARFPVRVRKGSRVPNRQASQAVPEVRRVLRYQRPVSVKVVSALCPRPFAEVVSRG